MEAGVRSGQLTPGDHLPPVRELAGQLGVSPTTVAAAYARTAPARHHDRDRPGRHADPRGSPGQLACRTSARPAGTRDLVTGGPDPDLLPLLPARPAGRSTRMYAEAPVSPRLRRLAADQLTADGIDAANLTVTGGALDGIERVLATWLTSSDRVIVEDPGHAVTFDLLAAMGYTAVPVPVDDLGMRPAELAAALARGAGALIVTPRAQAATGAAWNAGRAEEIAAVLRRYPAVGVIEDDHAGPVAGVPGLSVCSGWPSQGVRNRWVTLRSVSKSLGPDLRLAVMAGDEATITRVAGRQALGTGWVSYQLQEMVADMWADPSVAPCAEHARPRSTRAAATRCGRRCTATASRRAAGRDSPAGCPCPTRTASPRRWPRRAGRWPPASGSASRLRRESGFPPPAWKRPTRRRSRPTSPARCGTGPPAWTKASRGRS